MRTSISTSVRPNSIRYWGILIGDPTNLRVEVRVGIRPPKRVVSKLTVKLKKKVLVYDSQLMANKLTDLFILKQTVYVGGKVVGVCDYPSFYKLGFRFGPNLVVEIPRERRGEVLKTRLW
jgi:hypothetical protein